MGFVCLKACTLSGVPYIPGQSVSEEAVPASRVRSLKASGILADAELEHQLVDDGRLPIELGNGEAIRVDGNQILSAFRIATMDSKAAVKAVSALEDEAVLTLISAEDDRKTVKEAAAAKLEEASAHLEG